eukprot:g1244.t1
MTSLTPMSEDSIPNNACLPHLDLIRCKQVPSAEIPLHKLKIPLTCKKDETKVKESGGALNFANVHENEAVVPTEWKEFFCLPLRESRENLIDVSALLKKLEHATPNIWNGIDENDTHLPSTNGPPIRRAMHDRLGVKNITFSFTDDLYTRIIRFPWWYTWGENYLYPIFHQLGIEPHCVVRCLLAYLPPQHTIKVHHDTGKWTTQTHRCHVPIVTDATKVHFYSGPQPHKMTPMGFPRGFAFELNNRAKHYVHNTWDKPRIHLIFDYVESYEKLPPIEIRLLPQYYTLHPNTQPNMDKNTEDRNGETSSPTSSNTAFTTTTGTLPPLNNQRNIPTTVHLLQTRRWIRVTTSPIIADALHKTVVHPGWDKARWGVQPDNLRKVAKKFALYTMKNVIPSPLSKKQESKTSTMKNVISSPLSGNHQSNTSSSEKWLTTLFFYLRTRYEKGELSLWDLRRHVLSLGTVVRKLYKVYLVDDSEGEDIEFDSRSIWQLFNETIFRTTALETNEHKFYQKDWQYARFVLSLFQVDSDDERDLIDEMNDIDNDIHANDNTEESEEKTVTSSAGLVQGFAHRCRYRIISDPERRDALKRVALLKNQGSEAEAEEEGKEELLEKEDKKENFENEEGGEDKKKIIERESNVPLLPSGFKSTYPHFFIFGVMKCGTSSLYHYILQHPFIRPLSSGRKEPHIFDRKPHLAENFHERMTNASTSSKTSNNIHNNYHDKTLDLLGQSKFMWGDATPSYLLGGWTVASRMFSIAPDARLLLITRDPLERAYSQWKFLNIVSNDMSARKKMKREVQKGKSFEACLREDLEEIEKEVNLDILLDISNNNINCGGTPSFPPSHDAPVSSCDAPLSSCDAPLSSCDTPVASYLQLSQKFERKKHEFIKLQRLLDRRANSTHGAHSYILRGLYELQLTLFFNNPETSMFESRIRGESGYDRSQLLVVRLEDMKANVDNVMRKKSGEANF